MTPAGRVRPAFFESNPMRVLMLHGINHNMFGKRDPVQYGTTTLDEINASLNALGQELGATVDAFQTNSEAALCERIHQAYTDKVDVVLLNPTYFASKRPGAKAILDRRWRRPSRPAIEAPSLERTVWRHGRVSISTHWPAAIV